MNNYKEIEQQVRAAVDALVAHYRQQGAENPWPAVAGYLEAELTGVLYKRPELMEYSPLLNRNH